MIPLIKIWWCWWGRFLSGMMRVDDITCTIVRHLYRRGDNSVEGDRSCNSVIRGYRRHEVLLYNAHCVKYWYLWFGTDIYESVLGTTLQYLFLPQWVSLDWTY